MILADTSAWIELQRGTGSAVDERMAHLLEFGPLPTITEPVIMELLASRRSDEEVAGIRQGLLAFEMVPVGGLATWERASAIQRTCRARGETVRSMIDCLIAAVAIRESASLLHLDRDFDVIARHTPLRVEPAPGSGGESSLGGRE